MKFLSRLSIRAQLVLVLVVLTGCATVFVALLAYSMSRAAVRTYAQQVLGGAAADRKQRLLDLVARRRVQATDLLSNAELNCAGGGAMNLVCAREQMEDFAQQHGARCVSLAPRKRKAVQVGDCATLPLDELASGLSFGPFFAHRENWYALRLPQDQYGNSATVVFAGADLEQLFTGYGIGMGGRVYMVTPAGEEFGARKAETPASPPQKTSSPQKAISCETASGATLREVVRLSELGGGCVAAEMPQAEALASSTSLKNAAFLGALAWGTVALLIAYAVAYWLTAPIARLRQRVLSLQAGDFDAPVPTSGPAEVRDFAHTFAAMATSLKRSRALLVEQERLQATSQMAADLAHQIHNPLTSVTYALTLLRRDPTLSDRTRELLDVAQEEAERMARISRQLLGLYAAEAKTKCRIGEVLRRVLEDEATRLEGQALPVRLRLASDAEVRAVEPELRHAFQNLLHNAVRALPRGSYVTLHVYSSHSWHDPGLAGVRVVIADSGPGIPRESLARLGQAFTSTTNPMRGSGLGLWVARSIVRRHGGMLQVRSSTRAGRTGTCVSVFLPAA